jgi:sulfate adenylyltransferase
MNTCPPSGACIWLTGLSGAGKTRTAAALANCFLQCNWRVTVLDGDVLRSLSPPGPHPFSEADRHAQALRVADLARREVDNGVLVICALISPYIRSQDAARQIIGVHRLAEIFVDTPLSVCITRDVKGLYAKALRGLMHHFTGIDDPYERPLDPDIALDIVRHSVCENVLSVIALLEKRGLIPTGEIVTLNGGEAEHLS